MKEFLFSNEGRDYLQQEYVHNQKSTYVIAAERQTYPNEVRRALHYHGIALRDRKTAQETALSSGRLKHPTQGRCRSQDEKRAISDGMAQTWKEMNPDERQARTEQGRHSWALMTEADRERLLDKANDGVREAALTGSRLEKCLLTGLATAGFEVAHRPTLFLQDHKVAVDLLVTQPPVAIAVDGPGHHFPIWGEDVFKLVANMDAFKNDLLAQEGYGVLRVKCVAKTISGYQQRQVLDGVLACLKEWREMFPPLEGRLRQLEV